ncbi:MAG: alcohol dehydrogenase catalytic domain-containing protein [Myxococcales bacterium]|nr:alcohol dehydrogenase catalytic domain-containing protein [Myxococcales bacterium]
MTFERAILEETGWERSLVYRSDDTTPACGDDEVIVQVGACGVAHRDLVDREGRLPFLRLPIVQGHEFAGTVVSCGSKVTRWKAGDRVGALHRDHCGSCDRCLEGETSHCLGAARVFGITVDGGYASLVAAAESALYPIPAGLEMDAAAILNSTFGTAYRALTRFGLVGAGARVVIVGANGGVGIGGVQIARALGAEVAAVVRAAEHAEFVESLGATAVVVDDGAGFHKRLPWGGADMVLDCVGSPTFNASLRSTRLGGGLGVVGNVSERRAELNMGRLVVGDVRICGSSGATPRDLAALVELMTRAPMRFVIADAMPVSAADAAQRRLRAGGLHGRLVLRPGA